MTTTRTFEHDNKRYKIKGTYSTVNERIKVFVDVEEPEEQTGNRLKTVDDNVVYFDKRNLENGDITGLRVCGEAVSFIEELQDTLEKKLQAEVEEKEGKSVFTYRSWTGKKRTRADSVEEAAEHFSEKYDVDATPENVEKVEENDSEKESREHEATESKDDQKTNAEGNVEDETVCDAKGCGRRKNREGEYCQFHQELKAEAESTSKDATTAHPTGGRY